VASGTLSQNFINEKMSVQLLENNLSEGFYFLKVVSGEKVGTVKFLVK
jgi:hypothetical protein